MQYDPRAEYIDGLIFSHVSDLRDFFAEKRKSGFRCIFRPLADEERDAFFFLASELRDYTLSVDEVDTICSPFFINQNFSDVLNYGRHHHISVFACARRSSSVHRTLTALADEIITFIQTEPNDLDGLKKRGFDVEAVSRLPDFEYLTVV